MRIAFGLCAAILTTALIGCNKLGPVVDTTALQPPGVKWRDFSHKEGNYSVLMPGQARSVYQDLAVKPVKMKATGNVVEFDSPARSFAVLFMDIPTFTQDMDEVSAHSILDDLVSIKPDQGEIQKRSNLRLGRHFGQECYWDGKDRRKHLWRLIWCKTESISSSPTGRRRPKTAKPTRRNSSIHSNSIAIPFRKRFPLWKLESNSNQN